MKTKKSNIIKFLTVCFAPVITGAMFQSAHAASATWTGGVGGTGINLSDGANWSSGSAAFVSGDVVTFDNTTDLGTLTWTANLGPGFGATDGVIIDYTGTNNLTLDGVAGTPGLQWGLGDIIISAGAGAFSFGNGVESTIIVLRGASNTQTYTNDSSNTATFAADMLWRSGGGVGKTLNLDGSGDWLFNAALRIDATQGQTGMTVVKNGSGTVNFAAANNFGTSTASLTIDDGTLKVTAAGSLGSNLGSLAINSAFSYESTATQTISGIISGGGTFNQTAGNLTLTGANTFGGTTTITGGTLSVNGTGTFESPVTVNGPSARYLHNSSNPYFLDIDFTQGTVGGAGTISSLAVPDNSGATVANGNGSGGSGALTLDTLTFNGDAALSVTDDGVTGTSGIVVTGTLSTTPAAGTITVNASNSFWDSGVTYNLVTAGTFTASLGDFTLGTINGVTGRQAPSLVATASGIGLLISGDNPKWSGLDNSNWVVGSTGANSNWRLITLATPTNYIQGDVVLFDDSAANKTVSISAADVSPAVINFNNSAGNAYTINGPFGIAAGTLNKNGNGNTTISAPNTFTGGTTINAGTLTLSGAGTLGGTSNALTAAGGTVNLGGTSQTAGPLTITGAATLQNGTLNTSGLVVTNPSGFDATISTNLALGAGTLSKSGEGTLTLSGTTTYTGATTISGGILALGGTATLGSSSAVSLSGGSLDLGGTTQVGNAIIISAAATGGDTISNGTLQPASLSSSNSTTGIAVISANIEGTTGFTRTGGGGTVSLTGTNTFSGPLNFTGNGTVSIDDGTNTGGGAITYNSFGSTFTVNSGSYLTSGTTSNGYSEFRILNLNGGVFESQGNLFSSTLAISTVFNGGTLKCGNPAGITLFDANNQIAINGGGASIDTTVGSITVGLNTGGPAALANPLTRLNGTAFGPITLLGGNSLVSGIANNGTLEIQDNSTWNLNGIASSISGLEGNGTVTSSTGTAVLTITADFPYSYSGTIAGGASISIVKLGVDTQTLTGINTYTGNTTINEGTLSVSNPSFADTSTVTILPGATLNLNTSGATDDVTSLVIGEDPKIDGIYGALDSGAEFEIAEITGSGFLKVGIPASGYGTWAAANVDNQTADEDFNNDGVDNGIAYFMNDTGMISLPGIVAGAVTWTNGGNIDAAQYGTEFVVQTSQTLVGWDPVAIGALTTNTAGPSGSLTYTLPTGQGKWFVRLVVTPN
ncbi:MAG: autotransporter-associated beta strand repeat-containing protein [Akkermansiaceae bacterium]